MKTFLLVIVSLLSLNAFAAPSQSEVDRKALETLLKKSGQFIDQENGESVASMLSTALVTSEDTSNKVTNSCTYDVSDDMFKCSLFILNYDDGNGDNVTESSVTIEYELEREDTGLPSEDLFMLSVTVTRAG